jgi:CheY-like chemotaxis protein
MDGEQLMNYLAEHSKELPDILFLDLNMPRKNGFESLVEIRGIENFNELPIVILSTSFPQDKDYEMGMIKQLFNLGACVFIRKPKDPKELTQLISQAVYLATENTGMKSILNA